MSTTVELHRKDAELQAVRAELVALRAGVSALASRWAYKGEFGWGPWQEGHGPDIEGQILDECSGDLRALLVSQTSGAITAPAGVSGGLMCVVIVESGRLCACESHRNVPSALPYMNKHGEAACECHPETAAKYSVRPFPCNATTDAES